MAEDVFGIVGAKLGNFHVERVIAEGGFGVVYRAQHGAFRAPVALKCLKVPAGMTPDQQSLFLEKFREEAELLFRLSASIPEVVRPLHADVVHLADGRFTPFLALEWLEGESLDHIIAQRRERGQAPMGLHKLVRLLRPIAHALSRAHRFPGPTGPMAIIHRDLKPDNIFVTSGEGVSGVKILDFGIAAAKSATTRIAGRATGEDPMGAFTPMYAAPEQWVPKRYGQSGPWTDVWGLAITMVEALAGHSPIDGDLTTMMGTVLDEKRRPTPRNENVVVSPEVDAVFARALAVDPRDRTKDVERFWSELEASMGLPPSFTHMDARRELPDELPNPPSVRTLLASSTSPPAEASSSRPPRVAVAIDVVQMSAPLGGIGRSDPPGEAMPDLELDLPRGATIALGARAATPSAAPASRPSGVAEAAGGPRALASGPPSAAPISGPRGSIDGSALAPSVRPAGESRAGAPAAVSSGPPTSMDAIPLAPLTAAPVSRPRAAATYAPTAQSRVAAAEMSRLREKIRLPVKLIVAALAITALDLVATEMKGEPFSIGPLRPFWVAGPLALAAVVLALWRVFGQSDDD